MYLGLEIVSLYLENFEFLESGLKKSKVFIDLSNTTHQIHVIVGKIGTGKTFILSHLQPFATVGTLDIRNQDDQIIPGKDGIKIICYKSVDSEFRITHNYIWNNSSETHSTKSYIEKDGEELNPTGNVKSFQYIILQEFGLEQANLRLLRLGSNVSGFLEYTATDRKNYVASLLDNANAILALNRSFRDELRTYNTRVSILSNKLNQIGLDKEKEYQEELQEIQDRLSQMDRELKEKEAHITKHEAEIALVAPEGYDALIASLSKLMDEYDDLRNERDALQQSLLSLENDQTVEVLMKQIGGLESSKTFLSSSIQSAEEEYSRYQLILSKTEESIHFIQNDEHLLMLREEYRKQKAEVDQVYEKIKDFHCNYSSSYLKNLVADLHGIDILIADISQYDDELIRKCYLSDSSIVKWSNHQGDILTGRKVNLQKKMNNISYSATYTVTGIMYTPPYCPTPDCPYKKTHPFTLNGGRSKKEINREVTLIQEEIDRVESELYMYAEIPTIYTKLVSLKEKFKEISKVLKSIGCLLQDNLLKVLTRIDCQRWYHYDKIIDIQELAIVKESYYASLETFRQIEEELKQYESNDLATLTQKKEDTQQKLAEILQSIADAEAQKKQIDTELETAQRQYHLLLEKASNEERLKDLNHRLDIMSIDLSTIAKNADRIGPYAMVNDKLRAQIREITETKTKMMQRMTQLNATLSDLAYTKDEMKDILRDQRYLSLMVTATSSKEGIPLQIVTDFVKGCKDIANDLTFDIFEEDIQLENFDINEKEFYIPYSINGKYIRDVTKASQGQRSLFSIAIAFAFMQQLMIPYNIPLLDEPDAPLHKPEQKKFLSMILQQMKSTGSRQLFLITHSTTLEDLPVNYIATTEEDLNLQNGSTLVKLYD